MFCLVLFFVLFWVLGIESWPLSYILVPNLFFKERIIVTQESHYQINMQMAKKFLLVRVVLYWWKIILCSEQLQMCVVSLYIQSAGFISYTFECNITQFSVKKSIGSHLTLTIASSSLLQAHKCSTFLCNKIISLTPKICL